MGNRTSPGAAVKVMSGEIIIINNNNKRMILKQSKNPHTLKSAFYKSVSSIIVGPLTKIVFYYDSSSNEVINKNYHRELILNNLIHTKITKIFIKSLDEDQLGKIETPIMPLISGNGATLEMMR